MDLRLEETSVCPLWGGCVAAAGGQAATSPLCCPCPGRGQAVSLFLSLPPWNRSEETTEAFCDLRLKALSLSDVGS